MSREAEKAHVAKATKLVHDMMTTWSYLKMDKYQFPWPKGALKVTQLKPGNMYKHYNIDNIGPQHGSLVYYVGKQGNGHVSRYDDPRGMEWAMYKYRGEWVCCSGADRVAFFGPYRMRATGAQKGGVTSAKSGRKGPTQSALDFTLGTRRKGLDSKIWRVVRMHTATGKLSKRWQRI